LSFGPFLGPVTGLIYSRWPNCDSKVCGFFSTLFFPAKENHCQHKVFSGATTATIFLASPLLMVSCLYDNLAA